MFVRLLLISLAAAGLSGIFISRAQAQELPEKGPGKEDLEKEAGMLIDGLPTLDKQPDDAGEQEDHDKPITPVSVEKARAQLEQARRKQQRWEKLARQGVLSKAEAERSILEVARAQVRHERARVAQMEAQLEAIRKRVEAGNASADMADSAAAALASAQRSLASAEAQYRKTRIDLAQVNVDRHRRLHACGLVSRQQLKRAESELAKATGAAGEASGTVGAAAK